MSEADDNSTVVIEKELPHAPEKVWRALTQPALVAEWLLKNDFRPVVGHSFQFRADPVPNWNGIIDCKVLVVEPNKTLSYSWSSMGLESVVVMTLVASNSGTLLRVQQSGFRANQKAAHQGATYGWQKFLGGLERVVAGLQ